VTNKLHHIFLRTARSRFQASGPGGTMIRPCMYVLQREWVCMPAAM